MASNGDENKQNLFSYHSATRLKKSPKNHYQKDHEEINNYITSNHHGNYKIFWSEVKENATYQNLCNAANTTRRNFIAWMPVL